MAFDNAISWFEIPATDIDRAQRFYETIFATELVQMDNPQMKMRIFPVTDRMTQIGGCICDSGGFHQPSAEQGPLIYLNANPDVQTVLDRVEAAGGKVIVPKTEISLDHGFFGLIVDTEGNRIGLHSVPVSMLK